jgi:hypothetical protein
MTCDKIDAPLERRCAVENARVFNLLKSKRDGRQRDALGIDCSVGGELQGSGFRAAQEALGHAGGDVDGPCDSRVAWGIDDEKPLAVGASGRATWVSGMCARDQERDGKQGVQRHWNAGERAAH